MTKTRSYDVAMSEVLREAVQERRANPDGELLQVGFVQQGLTRKYRYPWDRMKLGDFFFVPLQGNSYASLNVRFRQAAARRDWELTVCKVLRDGAPAVRVCLTFVGVEELKRYAQRYHRIEGMRFGDGRWSERRKHRRAEKTAPAPRRGTTETREGLTTPTSTPVRLVALDGAPVDATLSPDYDRAAVMRERLKALGE